MPIVFLCPKCGFKLKAPDSLAGTRGQCVSCGAAILVPAVLPRAESPNAKPPSPRPAQAPRSGGAAAVAARGKKKEKRWPVVVALVFVAVLLLGGGAGAYYFLAMKRPRPAGSATPTVADKPATPPVANKPATPRELYQEGRYQQAHDAVTAQIIQADPRMEDRLRKGELDGLPRDRDSDDYLLLGEIELLHPEQVKVRLPGSAEPVALGIDKGRYEQWFSLAVAIDPACKPKAAALLERVVQDRLAAITPGDQLPKVIAAEVRGLLAKADFSNLTKPLDDAVKRRRAAADAALALAKVLGKFDAAAGAKKASDISALAAGAGQADQLTEQVALATLSDVLDAFKRLTGAELQKRKAQGNLSLPTAYLPCLWRKKDVPQPAVDAFGEAVRCLAALRRPGASKFDPAVFAPDRAPAAMREWKPYVDAGCARPDPFLPPLVKAIDASSDLAAALLERVEQPGALPKDQADLIIKAVMAAFGRVAVAHSATVSKDWKEPQAGAERPAECIDWQRHFYTTWPCVDPTVLMQSLQRLRRGQGLPTDEDFYFAMVWYNYHTPAKTAATMPRGPHRMAAYLNRYPQGLRADLARRVSQ